MEDMIVNSQLKAQNGGVSITSSGNTWVLKNPQMRVTISKATGQLLSLYTRRELLSAPADVLLIDKVAGKSYLISGGDPLDAKTHQTSSEASLTFSRTINNDYTFTMTFTITQDALRWDVAASTTLNTDREANIDFRLPVLTTSEDAFWAAPNVPAKIRGLRAQEILYRTATYVPWVCVYTAKTDTGLSLIAPPDVHKPGLTFAMETDANPKRIRVSNHHMRLGVQYPVKATLMLIPHEGDWRPGLGWLSKSYPDYFRPIVKRVTQGEGWYAMGAPTTTEAEIIDTAGRGVTWQELHGYFPFYGVYRPDRDNWAVAMDQDAVSIDRWEKGNTPELYQNSLANMRKELALWKKHGIQSYIYYQTFEAWHQYAVKYFAADIAHDAAGAPLTAWQFCRLMNPDPASPWGKAILEQLDKLIAAYSDIDGIFLDRDDYRDYDFSHDDGRTMQDSRACYMLGFAQEKALIEMGTRLHTRGLGIWTNGPTNLEVCKGVDGIMSEAVGPMANMTQFFGLERPMICLPYDLDATSTEIKLKACLSGGYFPGASGTAIGSPSRAIESKYMPLFELMKERKWVLNAHAITVPADVQGNLFQAPNGDYLAAVVSDKTTQVIAAGSSPAMTRAVKVKVNVTNANTIRHCYLLSGDYRGVMELPFKRSGNAMSTEIPLHIAASMLLFSPKPRYDLTSQTAPVLVRGADNMLEMKASSRGAISMLTPWGPATPDGSANKLRVTVPSDAPKGEVSLKVSAGAETTEFSAWVVDPVEVVTPLDPVFVRNTKGEEVRVNLTNHTDRPQAISITGSFVSGSGSVNILQPRLTLKPAETRAVTCHVSAAGAGSIALQIESAGTSQTFHLPVDAITPFATSDLFHDDFSSGSMSKWSVSSGNWRVSNGVAQATGPGHLALTGNMNWSDYSIEVTTKMDGSEQPEVTWLKSYVFFRVESLDNYYRFGLHGDNRSLELSKMVKGEWSMMFLHTVDIVPNTWVTFRVTAVGPDIRCYADGKLIFEAKESSLPKGRIGIGVMENSMVNSYRHVVVKRIE